jgi:hypothetical protein
MVGYDNEDPKSIKASGYNVFRERAVIFSTLGFQDWAKRGPMAEALLVFKFFVRDKWKITIDVALSG